MLKTTITFACAIMALALTANVNAQGCSSCGTASYGGGFGGYGGGFGGYGGDFGGGYGGDFGGYGMADLGTNNCGREISNQGAAALWGGYCTETCVSHQRGGLLGRHGRGGCGGGRGCGGGGLGKFGYPSGGGCCGNRGCFGYPTSCGTCGCGGGAGLGGFHKGCSLFGKHRARHRGLLGKLKGCGGGCSLFSKTSNCNYGYGGGFGAGGGCGSSCGLGGFKGFGLLGKLKGGHGCKLKRHRTQYAAVVTYPVTTVAVDQCGCGNSGEYFNYAVGAEYGTAGIQSGVSQVMSGSSCGCGGTSSVLDAGVQMYENTGAPGFIQ